jgi:hypothetical protein
MIAPTQLPSGRWRARYTAPNGQIRSAGTYDSEDEALEALRLREPVTGATDKPESSDRGELTFAAWAPMAISKKLALEESTIVLYEGYLRRTLIPYFGRMRLRDITVETVEGWAKEQKRARRKFRNDYICLRSIMTEAKKAERTT